MDDSKKQNCTEESDQDTKEQLSPEQQYALDSVVEGLNIFLTGSGGTGKSFCIAQIVETLRQQNKYVQLTSTTGISATHIGGITIHSFSGIGLGNQTKHEISQIGKRKYVQNLWQDIDTLIIDEISMLTPDYFIKLNIVSQTARNSSDPFGGVQVILVGDFFQLPPIHKENISTGPTYCFETELWDKLIDRSIELKQVFRQNDDTFVSLLNHIRWGNPTSTDLQTLRYRLNAKFPEDGIIPTILYPRNSTVDKENEKHLAMLPGNYFKYQSFILNPRRIMNGVFTDLASQSIPNRIINKYTNQLKRDCPSKEKINLKINTQVMLTANLSVMNGLANGSRGVVIGFDPNPPHLPIVKFISGKTFVIPFYSWKVAINRDAYMAIAQIPLRLASAYTIHRSQSQTVDRVIIQLNKRVFAEGQAYVALSRVRTLEGMSLLSFDPKCIRANKKVIAFYKHLQHKLLQTSSTSKERPLKRKHELIN